MYNNINIKDIEDFYDNIITKEIEIKVSSTYLKYLNTVVFDVKMNDVINLPIELLPFGSQKRIDVRCKECLKISNIKFQNYVSTMIKGHNYKCKTCNTFKNNCSRIY